MNNNSLAILAKNPLFQMSLGSKELFHSNFLAWALGQKDQKKFAIRFFEELKEFKNIEIKDIKAPLREKMNIDLMFTLTLENENEKEVNVIFENKVKSLPYVNQLIKYSEKVNKNRSINHFFLLTLTKPNFTSKEWSDIEEWNVIDYGMIADNLEKNLCYIKKRDEKISFTSFIESYIEFIRLLHQISEDLVIKKNEKFYYNTDEDLKPSYKDLRIHDLFLKLKYEGISNLIKDSVKAGIARDEFKIKPIPDYITFKAQPGSLYIGTGFSNAESQIEFLYNLGVFNYKEMDLCLVMGIQLQGNKFKYFVEIRGENWSSYPNNVQKKQIKDWIFKFANQLHNEKKWLCTAREFLHDIPDSIFKNDEEKMGKGRSTHDLYKNKFCGYNDIFLYKYDTISEKAAVSDLIFLFISILKYILKNKKVFKKMANQQIENLKV